MFKRVLIANRGEIAVRIIRGCREMDIETVAVYSTADESALHTQLATSSVCIGPAKASDSYLNMQNILSAALNTGCDAIHPGFGFLSENSDFGTSLQSVRTCLYRSGLSGDRQHGKQICRARADEKERRSGGSGFGRQCFKFGRCKKNSRGDWISGACKSVRRRRRTRDTSGLVCGRAG